MACLCYARANVRQRGLDGIKESRMISLLLLLLLDTDTNLHLRKRGLPRISQNRLVYPPIAAVEPYVHRTAWRSQRLGFLHIYVCIPPVLQHDTREWRNDRRDRGGKQKNKKIIAETTQGTRPCCCVPGRFKHKLFRRPWAPAIMFCPPVKACSRPLFAVIF